MIILCKGVIDNFKEGDILYRIKPAKDGNKSYMVERGFKIKLHKIDYYNNKILYYHVCIKDNKISDYIYDLDLDNFRYHWIKIKI